MGFNKMTRPTHPPRLWSLEGYPGSGKSSFAAQMKSPMVVIDADHRFTEVLDVVDGDVFELSDIPADNVNPNTIKERLEEGMPGSGVRTIVVDSLTAIITPLVVQAMIDKEADTNLNLSAAFRTKALAMRQIQDAITRWGCDTLWIYHLQRARDNKANEIERTSISRTELARLKRSINLQLRIIHKDNDPDVRGIHVVWARRGRDNVTIWDDSGCWKGMPEKIEEMVYKGLTPEEQDQIEKSTPEVFSSPEHAISWACERGAFTEPERAGRFYEKVKKESKPTSAREMADAWVAAIEQREADMREREAAATEASDDAAF